DDSLNYFYPNYPLVKNAYRRQKEKFNRDHFIIGKGELIVKKKMRLSSGFMTEMILTKYLWVILLDQPEI
ncbi:MAG: hypothetical protein AAFR66_10475, partial [Bacteroidota bacterium]